MNENKDFYLKTGKALLLYGLVTNSVLDGLLLRAGWDAAWVRWTVALAMLAAVLALVRAWCRQDGLSGKDLGVFPVPGAGVLLLGAGAAILSVASERVITRFAGLDLAGNRASVLKVLPSASDKMQLAALSLVFVAIEEVFFRGYLLAVLRKRHGNAVAVVATSIVFSAYHFNWTNAPHHLAMGLICGTAAVATGSLYPALLAHWLHNVHALLY